MSIFTSCFLLFFLCLSHVCNARRLGAVEHTNDMVEKKLHFSSKSDIQVEVKYKVESIKESSKDDDLVNHKKGKATLTKKSGATVTWKVPRRKRDDKHPGFSLDYSPPKTHPPSHN